MIENFKEQNGGLVHEELSKDGVVIKYGISGVQLSLLKNSGKNLNEVLFNFRSETNKSDVYYTYLSGQFCGSGEKYFNDYMEDKIVIN